MNQRRPPAKEPTEFTLTRRCGRTADKKREKTSDGGGGSGRQRPPACRLLRPAVPSRLVNLRRQAWAVAFFKQSGRFRLRRANRLDDLCCPGVTLVFCSPLTTSIYGPVQKHSAVAQLGLHACLLTTLSPHPIIIQTCIEKRFFLFGLSPAFRLGEPELCFRSGWTSKEKRNEQIDVWRLIALVSPCNSLKM